MPADRTIEQLAAETGMSVRNIRAHQSRGMLDPPDVRLRVGYYGPQHVARLRLIRDLQEKGFNLAGIRQLLDDQRGIAEPMARLRLALSESARGERPTSVTAAELSRRFGITSDQAPEILARAERLGIIRGAGPGAYEAPHPSLLTVAEQVIETGISLAAALTVFEQIGPHLEAVAGAFVRLFADELWQPFQTAGAPDEGWHEIERSIDRLLPVAGEAVAAAFGQQMTAQLDRALGRPRTGSPKGHATA